MTRLGKAYRVGFCLWRDSLREEQLVERIDTLHFLFNHFCQQAKTFICITV